MTVLATEACVSGAQWVRGAWWVVPQKWQGSDVYGFAFLGSNEGASRGWEQRTNKTPCLPPAHIPGWEGQERMEDWTTGWLPGDRWER